MEKPSEDRPDQEIFVRKELLRLRDSIDNLDAALVHLLAERFKCTQEVGRLKAEYQLTRSIFVRAVGEYDLSEHDDLRDETRTFFPLIIDGQRAIASRSGTLHGDYLFAFQPNPGTVLFVGYGSRADGLPDVNDRFKFQPLIRSSDYFFVKYSYLFRM